MGPLSTTKPVLLQKVLHKSMGSLALVARISSIRALLAVAAASKWDIFQMDVKNVFLNGNLSEEVYMHDNALKCILAIYLCGRYLVITMLNLYN